MNKLIETLAALNLSSATTKITRLENGYEFKSDYGYNDGYYQYDVHYYIWMRAEVDMDGNILSASLTSGSEFWNGGGEMSEKRVVKLEDPEWELPNEAKEVILENEAKILELKVGEVLKLDREGKSEYVAPTGRIGLDVE